MTTQTVHPIVRDMANFIAERASTGGGVTDADLLQRFTVQEVRTHYPAAEQRARRLMTRRLRLPRAA